MNKPTIVLAAAAIVALAAASANAQTGSVTGRVTDAQGAAVVNATVTLTSSAGRRMESRTGGDGAFSFDQVPAGAATLQVDAPGFATSRQTVTASASPAPLTITLRVAGLREEVRVVGRAETTLDTPAPTGSRLGLTPLETPASVSVLAGDTIRERGVQSVVEAKSQAVGVTNRSNPGNAGNGLAMRGFSDTASVMQLFDGELMFVGNNTVSFPFDPWMVERIEVLGGPASVLYGNGAIGGVINVVPKRPNARSRESSVRVAGGSFNTWRGAADTAGPIGTNTGYQLGFSGNRSDGWLKNYPYPSDTTAFSASLRHQFRPNLSLTVSEDFGYQRPFEYFGTPTIDGTVEPARRDVNYNTADAKIWYRDSWTQAKLEWQPSPNVSVRNSLRLIDRAGYWFDVEEYVYMPATNQVARAVYLEAGSWLRQYGDRTDVIVSSRPFGRSNTLSAGFEYNFVNYRVNWNSSFGGSSVTDLQNTTPGTFISDDRMVPQFQTHTHHTAFLAEDRFAVSSKVSLVGGVRLDRYAVDRLDLIDNSTAERTFNPPSWRGGIVYSVKPTLSVYGQVAQATDTIGNIISSSPGQMILDPTVGRQVEGGVKQSLGSQRIEWTVAGYYIKKTKLVAPVPGQPGVSQQIGAQSSRGVEATAAITLPKGVRIDANLAVLDARFDDFAENVGGVVTSRVGNTPPSVPERAANVWLTWMAPRDWHVRGGLRSVGKRYSNNANTFQVPSYTIVDAGVRKALTARVAVDLHLLNLTNALYATDVYYNGFAPQWMLGPPRSAEVALTFGF